MNVFYKMWLACAWSEDQWERAQKAAVMIDKDRWQQAERAYKMSREDFNMSLWWVDDHMPENMDEANVRMNAIMSRIRKYLKKHGWGIDYVKKAPLPASVRAAEAVDFLRKGNYLAIYKAMQRDGWKVSAPPAVAKMIQDRKNKRNDQAGNAQGA